jgi:hypothetical protein
MDSEEYITKIADNNQLWQDENQREVFDAQSKIYTNGLTPRFLYGAQRMA